MQRAVLRSWLDAFDAHAMQSALWGDADNEVCAARICKGNAALAAAVLENHPTVCFESNLADGSRSISSAEAVS